MNASSREKVDQILTKEEVNHTQNQDRLKLGLVASSGRRWSAFRNPRIVRVSRTFGGKDRHSKVCTVRGLRDRRIRLSIPTAVQLYDLQDRLGLDQPSKVIDWLIEATKLEIDKLPPLHLPPGFGGFFPLASPELFGASQSSISTFLKNGYEMSMNEDSVIREDSRSRSKYWEKGKEIETRESQPGKSNKFVELPNIPTRVTNLISPHTLLSLSQYQLGIGQHSFTSTETDRITPRFTDDSLSLSSSLNHSNPNLYCSPYSTIPIIPQYLNPPSYNNSNNNTIGPHFPLPVENNFQLFSTSAQSFVPSLHLFGSSAVKTFPPAN